MASEKAIRDRVLCVSPNVVLRAVRILCSVSLMVYGNSHVIAAVVETRPACEMFLHGWQRARRSSEICVSTDRSRVSRTSSEIMLKLAVIRVAVSVARAGVEGRGGRRCAAVLGDDAVVVSGVGLPIGNGVEALVKLLGATQLPFTEYCPKDGNGTNRRSNDNEDCDKGCLARLA